MNAFVLLLFADAATKDGTPAAATPWWVTVLTNVATAAATFLLTKYGMERLIKPKLKVRYDARDPSCRMD